MDYTKFINRKKELAFLRERYNTKSSQLLILYGRRRVGKTSLLLEFCKDKPHVYLLADLKPEKEQLRDFSYQLAKELDDDVLKHQPLETADAFLSYLIKVWRERQMIIIIDEYPYLCKVNHAFSSILQKYWDLQMKEAKAFLILCGSSIGMMEKETLKEESPLYGRRSGDWLVTPLRFREFLEFFPDMNMEQCIPLYSIVGGIPEYILKLDKKKSEEQNILSIIKKGSPLYREVEFSIREELVEPHNYFAILKAISFGKNTVNEIVQYTGLEKGLVSKYISILEHLSLIKRIASITENKEKTRKGQYILLDNYFRFWFRFCFPYKSLLEEGKEEIVFKREILPHFSEFVSPIFENVCREFLIADFDEVGSWWYKENEIDIVAKRFDNKEILFGECKWTNQQRTVSDIQKLIMVSEKTDLSAKQKKYAFFSKAGFTKEALLFAKENPAILLYTLNRLKEEM